MEVDNGDTFTIEPGVILKFDKDKYLRVRGALVANGTVGNPILFTSYKDDTAGGDTNGDGDISIPVPGDWDGIDFGYSSDGADETCLMNYCRVFYADNGIYILKSANNVTVANSLIQYHERAGIYVSDCSPRIRGNLITDNILYGVDIASGVPDLGTTPDPGRNTLRGNGTYDLRNYSTSDIPAIYNFWGTTDGGEIESHIYDKIDDDSRGMVAVNPFLTGLPFITSIAPNLGPVGTIVKIKGHSFGETQEDSIVTFNGLDAGSAESWSETEIIIKVPEGATTGPVVVTVDEIASNSDYDFFVGAGPTGTVGDVSGDGTVSALDAALILQFIVGIIDEFPVSSMFSPSLENALLRDYQVSIPAVNSIIGKRVQIPILVNPLSSLYAGGFIIKYDSEVVRVTKVLMTNDLSHAYWEANTELDGEIRFAFTTTLPPQKDDGEILLIEFEPLPNTDGKVSPLMFDTVQLYNSKSIVQINGSLTILPSEYRLLQNYPNPFNPETWLPYQLANDVLVTINIYNSKGQLVRTLHLGNQKAGVYITKDSAAHWDGKNSLGQSVASGLYFYTLQVERSEIPKIGAGEFRATRKMVILK